MKNKHVTKEVNLEILETMKELYELAQSFTDENPLLIGSIRIWNKYVTDYYRYEAYDGIDWDILAGSVSTDYLYYVVNNSDIEPYTGSINHIDPSSGIELDLDHQMGALASLMHYNVEGEIDFTRGNTGDVGGWAGDLSQFTGVYYKSYSDEFTISEYIDKYLFLDGSDSAYGLADHMSDIDAINIYLNGGILDNTPIHEAFQTYYEEVSMNRYRKFFELRCGGSEEQLYKLSENTLTADNGLTGNGIATNIAIWGIYDNEALDVDLLENGFIESFFQHELHQFAREFSDKQMELINSKYKL